MLVFSAVKSFYFSFKHWFSNLEYQAEFGKNSALSFFNLLVFKNISSRVLFFNERFTLI